MENEEFDLPDEGGENVGNAGRSSFVSDLFGSTSKRPTTAGSAAGSNRSTFDDILANAPRRRQVTFQTKNEPQQQSASEESAKGAELQPQSSLLDSLFSNTTGGVERRTRNTTTTSTLDTVGGGGIGPQLGNPTIARPQSKEISRGTTQQTSSNVRPSSSSSIIDPSIAQIPPSQSSYTAILQTELDQLRRELSTLRYERSEDQRSLTELKRKLDMEQEEHRRIIEREREEKRMEMQEMARRHQRELEDTRREADRSADLLNGIREQQGSFESLSTRLEALNFGISQIRDLTQSIGIRGDELEKGWREQQDENWKRMNAEKEHWEKATRAMDVEMGKLREEYEKEIVEGRRWLEQQREMAQTEKQAFRDEQELVLDWIERTKEQLEAEKTEFLRREHDLLVRVLNERAYLEQERREFIRQRDADVSRLRAEAEYLEQSLTQVESAKKALNCSRAEFERRNGQLNQLRNELGRYEQLATQLIRSQHRRRVSRKSGHQNE